MMIARRAVALIALGCGLGSAAAAEPAVCYGMRQLGAPEFVEPALKVVAPDAPKRLHFVKTGDEDKACPGPQDECRREPYLTPGDAVIVGTASGGYVCATFQGPKPAMALSEGFLPSASLIDPRPKTPRLADWVGSWRSGPEKRISVKLAGERLNVEGEATYGALDANRVASGAVHTGGFEGKLSPDGSSAGLSIGADGKGAPYTPDNGLCSVRFWRLGGLLVASDNGSCGGLNVTFTGVYRRD